MSEPRSPAEHAERIAAARDRLIAFASACTDEVWYGRPLAGHGDERAVGVIVDHVADSYEFMGGWIEEILAGRDPHVDVALVDQLNADHATEAGQRTQAGAVEHLQRSGDALIALIGGLAEPDLEAGGGRVRMFAEISARHADNHRADIDAALGAG
jgi:hypothetical protein